MNKKIRGLFDAPKTAINYFSLDESNAAIMPGMSNGQDDSSSDVNSKSPFEDTGRATNFPSMRDYEDMLSTTASYQTSLFCDFPLCNERIVGQSVHDELPHGWGAAGAQTALDQGESDATYNFCPRHVNEHCVDDEWGEGCGNSLDSRGRCREPGCEGHNNFRHQRQLDKEWDDVKLGSLYVYCDGCGEANTPFDSASPNWHIEDIYPPHFCPECVGKRCSQCLDELRSEDPGPLCKSCKLENDWDKEDLRLGSSEAIPCPICGGITHLDRSTGDFICPRCGEIIVRASKAYFDVLAANNQDIEQLVSEAVDRGWEHNTSQKNYHILRWLHAPKGTKNVVRIPSTPSSSSTFRNKKSELRRMERAYPAPIRGETPKGQSDTLEKLFFENTPTTDFSQRRQRARQRIEDERQRLPLPSVSPAPSRILDTTLTEREIGTVSPFQNNDPWSSMSNPWPGPTTPNINYDIRPQVKTPAPIVTTPETPKQTPEIKEETAPSRTTRVYNQGEKHGTLTGYKYHYEEKNGFDRGPCDYCYLAALIHRTTKQGMSRKPNATSVALYGSVMSTPAEDQENIDAFRNIQGLVENWPHKNTFNKAALQMDSSFRTANKDLSDIYGSDPVGPHCSGCKNGIPFYFTQQGPGGNAFHIMGDLHDALVEHNAEEHWPSIRDEMMSSDYTHLLNVVRQHPLLRTREL